jgi:hypothetical protein
VNKEEEREWMLRERRRRIIRLDHEEYADPEFVSWLLSKERDDAWFEPDPVAVTHPDLLKDAEDLVF